MVLLEQYITLYEKESKFVLSAWKGFQISLYALAGLTGIAISYCISQLTDSFGGNCILFSNVTLMEVDSLNGTKTTVPVVLDKTEWGKASYCSFCQYVPVCSVIFSVVWGTFFIMCGKGGKTTHGLSQPWRIVYPALIFNFIFFLVALVAAIRLQQGIGVFCSEFVKNNNETDCRDLGKYTLADNRPGYMAFDYISTSEIASWINVSSWFLGVSLLILRCLCVADFTVMKITIIAPTPDEAPKASPESLQFPMEEEVQNENLLNVAPTL